jgi:hypothetical protein
MAQAVSLRPVTSDAGIRARVIPCSVALGQALPRFSVSPANIIPLGLHTLISPRGMKNRPVCDRSSETYPRPIGMKNFVKQHRGEPMSMMKPKMIITAKSGSHDVLLS